MFSWASFRGFFPTVAGVILFSSHPHLQFVYVVLNVSVVHTGERLMAQSTRDRRPPKDYMFERNFEFKFLKK